MKPTKIHQKNNTVNIKFIHIEHDLVINYFSTK